MASSIHSSGNSKLKLTILASEWGSSKGGLSTINRELAIQLAKFSEVEITLFLPQCSKEDEREALNHHITIVKATRWPGYDELDWLSFPPDDLQIDVIVGHGVKLGRQAQVIRRSHKCKWIQVVHTYPEELGMYKSYQSPISTGEKKHKTEVELCEKADFVVGVGPKLSEAFRSYLRWCERDETILDFTPGVFDEFASVKHATEERKRCGVLVFGRGDAEDFQLKGFDIAGKAVAQLNDAHLYFVGAPEGKHEDIAKRLLECGIPAHRLTVRSFLQSREDLKHLFCQVDLVLMPSRTEGFGLTGLEALSAGLPVLVSKNSGFGEALQKVPFGSSSVIDSEDAKEWSEAIRKIWSKDRETRLAEAEVLRSSYEKKYSWAKQSQDLVTKMISITNNSESSSQAKHGLPVSSVTQGRSQMKTEHPAGILTSTKEESNYAKLCQPLVALNSIILRKAFDRIIPPHKLQRHLEGFRVRVTLQLLQKQGILNSKQWGQLYPTHDSWRHGKSHPDVDPTLLMILLGIVCKLTPPAAGWDASPHAGDTSREADIARVRYFMNTVFSHADKASVSDAVIAEYWENVREMLVSLSGKGYGHTMDEMKNQKMDPPTEEHYKELLKQWKKNDDCIRDKMNEVESAMEGSGNEDILYPFHVKKRIHQLYKTREERILPLPWCEDFSFHLNEIFTRLRIVSKEKTRGTLNEDITNMTAIFKSHDGCHKPRTVLIEGDPGMGKTTYCQKLAYDWANGQQEWDESFPEIELLLLLKCHDIQSNIWEAIDEQILPDDLDEESKENFFKFICENQCNVLLVLDGLDEADPRELPMYIKLVESRELPECYIILTSRHEAGMKFRRFCDTLWEIVGFTKEDAETFIFKYFKGMKQMADKLFRRLFPRYGSRDLREMTSNPLNTALLCVLWEDLKGNLPTSRTQLYVEIVLCILRRYEVKNSLSSSNNDLIKGYEEELIHLGLMALISLRKRELYIGESECGRNSTALIKFGFLSVQSAGSRRKPCLRCGFLHKSFQEFFAGFYLASKILSGEIDLNTVVSDERYFKDLNQVLLFMSGIVASKCEETTVCLVKHIAAKSGASKHDIEFAFNCIKECLSYKENLSSQLVCTFGSHLDIKALTLDDLYSPSIKFFFESLGTNTTLTSLHLEGTVLDNSVAASLSKALSSENTALLYLDLYKLRINDSGAGFLADALSVNTTLTHLYLSGNEIGDSGASSISAALAVNTALTILDLTRNDIGASGACSLSKALTKNTTLTHLHLSRNEIGDSGAGFLSDALSLNTTLTHLDLSGNKIGDSGASSISAALAVNTALTILDLTRNDIGASGACSLSKALTKNTTLTHLHLSRNEIGDSGASFLSDALSVNTTLTHLDLSGNKIGDSGASSISAALAVNTALTILDLTRNDIGASGACSLSKALTKNTTLTHLHLSRNEIGDSGAGFLSDALSVNTTLTHLDLSGNKIGDSGASSISAALAVNTALTILELTRNDIGAFGASFLSKALTRNTTLTHLDLSRNAICPSGAVSLSKALTKNTALTNLVLSRNQISDSGAVSLAEALSENTSLTKLNLSRNNIGESGACSIFKALTVNTTLTHLYLGANVFGPSCWDSLSDAQTVNTTCRVEV